jgi:serine phosphatase RsbU (regulator of sigma subunit)
MGNSEEGEAIQAYIGANSSSPDLDKQGKGEILARIPLFTELPKSEIHHLADALQWREVQAGTVLFCEGELGQCLTILVDGQIEIVKALGSPDEHILAVIGARGDFLGEMSMFYRDGIRSASARTRTDAHLLELQRADFDELLHRHPELAIGILKQLSVRLRNSEDATIRDLQEKNRQLAQAYLELQAAQAQIIEKEKLEHDLRMARRIQESILPKEMPSIEGLEFSAFWNPARAVSGDFYDFIEFPDGKLGLLVGDVTDKGMPAALVMATTRSVLRVAAKKRLSPGSVLSLVNDLLCPDMPQHMFVTCLCAEFDPSSGHLRFANAGHDLPYQLTDKGPVELRATGFPLGLLPGMSYEENEADLEPGDSLLLYSDGLVEAHNSQGGMFGFPRLRQVLVEYLSGKKPAPSGPASLVEFLNRKLEEFTGPDWEQEDDVTLVVLERLRNPA